MKEKTCCFIGHREINESGELKERLYGLIRELITNKGIDTFLFGSRSRFNELCYETVSRIKEEYPDIKRIYVRGEYPYINDDYRNYLLQKYEDTYFPERIIGAGRSVYTERNQVMIENSGVCVFYYDEKTAAGRKSGTRAALENAKRCKKEIVLLE